MIDRISFLSTLLRSRVTREDRGRPPRVNIQGGGGWRPNEIYFLWLDLERTLDKWYGKMGVVRRRQLKRSLVRPSTFQRAMTKKGCPFFFQEKIGWHHSVPPRVSLTLVTPPSYWYIIKKCAVINADNEFDFFLFSFCELIESSFIITIMFVDGGRVCGEIVRL